MKNAAKLNASQVKTRDELDTHKVQARGREEKLAAIVAGIGILNADEAVRAEKGKTSRL
jgi:hypothetical protein